MAATFVVADRVARFLLGDIGDLEDLADSMRNSDGDTDGEIAGVLRISDSDFRDLTPTIFLHGRILIAILCIGRIPPRRNLA